METESQKRGEIWRELRRVEDDCDGRHLEVSTRLTHLETIQAGLTRLCWIILAAIIGGELKEVIILLGG